MSASGPIVGREVELARLDEFLRARTAGPSALLIEGEAGAGKTTLWAEAVRRGDAAVIRILTCSPSESEAKLSFVPGDETEPSWSPDGSRIVFAFDDLGEPEYRSSERGGRGGGRKRVGGAGDA